MVYMANTSRPRPDLPSSDARPPRDQRIARSRSGCETCKLRKIKCDETRPVCNRCKLRNRPCRYSPPKTWLFESDAHLEAHDAKLILPPTQQASPDSGNDSSASSSDDLTLLPYIRRHDDPRRLASFQYFSNLIIAPTDADPKFYPIWSKETCAQLRREEPAVDYLIGALSTVHRAVIDPHAPDESQYYYHCVGKAVTRMRSAMLDLSDEAFVICNIMVGMCELMRTGNVGANAEQIERSFFFLSTWQKDYDRASQSPAGVTARQRRRKDIVDELTPYISTACSHYHVTGQVVDRSRLLNDAGQVEHTGWYDFRTLDEAANSLEDVLCRRPTYLDLELTESWIITNNTDTVDVILRFWENSFDELKDQLEASGTNDSEQTLIDAIEAVYSFARANHPASKLDFEPDTARADLRRHSDIVQRYERLLDTGNLLVPGRSGWDFPVTMIGPLFFVACRGRERALRARALATLGSMDVTEGAWNSRTAYNIAKALQPVCQTMAHALQQRLSRAPYVHELPVLWPWRIDCTYNSPLFTEATLLIKYGFYDGSDDASATAPRFPVTFATTTLLLDGAADVQACRGCKWPMDATVKSSGVFKNNVVSTPYVPSNKFAFDRIRRTQQVPRRRWLN